MKRAILTSLSVLIVFSGYISWAMFRPLPQLSPIVTLHSDTTAAPTLNIKWPSYGQQAIGTADDGVLATTGEQKAVPIASVAKVMVALAVLNKKPLALAEGGPNIPITAEDVAIYWQNLATNQSVVAVQQNEVLNEHQALQALLIASANNIATTLTNWAFGSQDAYLTYANNYAKKLGMQNTNFADASGLSPNTVSTASDLILLGQEAVKNPVIAQIVKQNTATVPVAGQIRNYNSELGGLSGINGIKTGNTNEAGGCFLFSRNFYGTQLLGAIVGAPDLATALNDSRAVINSFDSSLQRHVVIKKGQIVAYYNSPQRGAINAIAQKEVGIIDTKGSQYKIKSHITSQNFGSSKNSVVGSIDFTYRGKVYSSPVTLSQSIQKPSTWWRFTHPF